MTHLTRALSTCPLAFALLFGQALAPATNKAQAPPAKSPTSKPPMGPPVSQSRHYPILLIAQGTDPSWNLRLGMKGPERLDRAGYPPVPLEPSDVEQETTGLSWIYHAKDSQTNAVVAVHVSRETCADGTSETKYTFRVSLDHAQIGALKGCAKVAPDQFPEFKQKNIDDDDPEKQKPTPPTFGNFKPPVAVAYLDSTGRVMLAHNDIPKPIAPTGSQLSLSHDGKRLLFVTEENGPIHGLKLYDSTTGKTIELASGLINRPFWSPDDSKIAFLKEDNSMWHVWTTLPLPGSQSTQLSATPVALLDGWANTDILVAANSDSFLWMTTDGGTSQVLSTRDICGSLCESNFANPIRVSPANPDLLVIGAGLPKAAANSPGTVENGHGGGIFLYEVRAKRLVAITPPNLFCENAEWSRDGLQIFFTGADSSGKRAIYRIFWDGTGLKKIRSGSNLVIGQ